MWYSRFPLPLHVPQGHSRIFRKAGITTAHQGSCLAGAAVMMKSMRQWQSPRLHAKIESKA